MPLLGAVCGACFAKLVVFGDANGVLSSITPVPRPANNESLKIVPTEFELKLNIPEILELFMVVFKNRFCKCLLWSAKLRFEIL